MAVRALEHLDDVATRTLARQQSALVAAQAPPVATILGLQRSAGNAAVVRHLTRTRAVPVEPGPRPVVPVQRCGPVACECSAEERVDYEVQHRKPGPNATVQRWPFSDDEQETEESPSGGIVDWVVNQAGGAADAVSGAAGGAVDWAQEQGGVAVEAVTDAAGGAVDWAQEQAVATLDEKRRGALALIAGARGQLGGLDRLPLDEGRLTELNARLGSLRASSGGQVALPALTPEGNSVDGGSRAVSAGAVDSLLAGLQTVLSGPVAVRDQPAQPSVQRLAGGDDVVVVVVVAGGTAAGLSLGAILAIIAVVLVVLALIAYAIYRLTRTEEKTEKNPQENPHEQPQEKKEPKVKEKDRERKRCLPDRDCREHGLDPCPSPLSLGWPAELPLPGPGRLIRVKDEDVSFPKERRGGAQARLSQEIAENRRRLLPPPRPCDPAKEADPNEPRDAHHRHPLALGGRDADENLCSLEAVAHQSGHPRLADQAEFADEYRRECCYCSANINLHPAGQEYIIHGRK
jgi:Na+-transporting methylmalonyl-CoA/oxaloacetate decarboxylase gamma subunit